MKIGIISDSHGDLARLRLAVAALAERGAEALVHCGDMVLSETLEVLGAAGLPAYAVAGNMDRHVAELQAAAQVYGVHFSVQTILVPIGAGQYLAATHGDNLRALAELSAEARFRYVCYGHTHMRTDQRRGSSRWINPGALQRAPQHTVALLDTQTDVLEFIEIP